MVEQECRRRAFVLRPRPPLRGARVSPDDLQISLKSRNAELIENNLIQYLVHANIVWELDRGARDNSLYAAFDWMDYCGSRIIWCGAAAVRAALRQIQGVCQPISRTAQLARSR